MVKKTTGPYPALTVDGDGSSVVPHAGATLLLRTAQTVRLPAALSDALAPWRKPLAIHDPAKVVLDLAVSLAIGGNCLADIAQLRAAPEVFGLVASDPTVSRCIDTLGDAPAVLAAINTARAATRTRAWALAGEHAPDRGADAHRPVVIDVDATLVTAHSEKEAAAPTFKRGFGHHPLWAFDDHGAAGTGEPLAFLLRAGNAGSNTVVDHKSVIRDALAQLPGGHRRGKKVPIRIDGAGGTHELLAWLTRRRLSYSVGFSLPGDLTSIQQKLATIPEQLWEPAYDADGQPRPGAFVAEVTDLFDLTSWPPGMRLIVRKERPHPGAQLRITDVDGMRITAFVTNTTRGQLADLELRHRRRARAEDRIRCAKDTGLANLPPHDLAQNSIWCAIVSPACELTAWIQTLTLIGHDARRWEPKRLRLRLFSIPARHARTGRRRLLHLAATAPFTQLVLAALDALAKLTAAPLADTG
ncbi:IS1380 family transposase [Blastococcus capsensis]|uniref:IS1380 family transposase n=1 Tax=Blastococcus capsensis TaxID=1564163 RepID=UPI002541DE21|nr:IS1380 family transposase [Blastococcus capsensis]MDK3258851.1 IS1380 family transposase [Blastococcus capsensis]